MINLTATELLKLRTTRAPWVVAAVLASGAIALVIFIASVAGSRGTEPLQPDNLPLLVRAPGQIVGFGMILLGVLSVTAEFRHRTAVTTFLAEPRRGRMLAAKGLAMATVAACVAALVAVVTLATAAAEFQVHDVAFQLTSHGTPAAIAGLLAAAVLSALLGVALGALLPNTAAALTCALVWTFVIEGVLPVVTRNPGLVRWLPDGALGAVRSLGAASDQVISPLSAVVVLLAYVAALALAGLVLLQRREV